MTEGQGRREILPFRAFHLSVSPNPGSTQMAQLIFTGPSVDAGHYTERQKNLCFLLLYAIDASGPLLAMLSLHFLLLHL